MTLATLPVLLLVLAAVTVFAHILRFPDGPWTQAQGRRIKWSFLALVFWLLTTRWLATVSFHPCQVDARLLAMRGNGGAGFIECSPQLLSAGPASLLFFVWLWAPMALIAALCLRHLARIAAAGREARR